ncbi:uncharacterized protein [Rutidosis leptorrhynchoides]|uniref:uncharacterized protein n=1 Tax=Rutidosis leptorrhynchoides TaxID=125765 RepID=UPI003A99F554
MFSATCEILMIIIDDGATSTQRADVDTAYEDILNAMDVVKSTKTMIQELRDKGWADLIKNVNTFCESVSIPVPNLDDHYIARRGRARHQQEDITMEHHYKVDKYYPQDFAGHEKAQLKVQFEHFGHMIEFPDFQELSTISYLCKWMVSTRKSSIYPLVYIVVILILTLPISTATTERSFSAMNIIKNKLRNKIADEFLSDFLLVYIEKEIAEAIDVESIVNDFRDMKTGRLYF